MTFLAILSILSGAAFIFVGVVSTPALMLPVVLGFGILFILFGLGCQGLKDLYHKLPKWMKEKDKKQAKTERTAQRHLGQS